MAGRKTKYTPEAVETIIRGLSVGATAQHAAWAAGISEDTFARWYGRYADFADRVDVAIGMRAVKWLALWEQDIPRDWRAAQAKLQTCERDSYGKEKSEIHHTGKDGGPLRVILERFSKAE